MDVMRSWSIESAGSFDRDMEVSKGNVIVFEMSLSHTKNQLIPLTFVAAIHSQLRVWFKGFWNNKIKQDLRKGKADIFAIQSHIAHFIIGSADGKAALANAQAYKPSPSGAMSTFLGYLNDAHMKDPVELTSKLRSSPALLQPDESIDAAFKCGRDLFLISTKRIIVIDKKGVSILQFCSHCIF